MPSERRVLRCVIYTRKSSEHGLEQDFNSLHAQREAGEAYSSSSRRCTASRTCSCSHRVKRVIKHNIGKEKAVEEAEQHLKQLRTRLGALEGNLKKLRTEEPEGEPA